MSLEPESPALVLPDASVEADSSPELLLSSLPQALTTSARLSGIAAS